MVLSLPSLGLKVNAVCTGYIQNPARMDINLLESTTNFFEQYISLNKHRKVEEIATTFFWQVKTVA